MGSEGVCERQLVRNIAVLRHVRRSLGEGGTRMAAVSPPKGIEHSESGGDGRVNAPIYPIGISSGIVAEQCESRHH